MRHGVNALSKMEIKQAFFCILLSLLIANNVCAGLDNWDTSETIAANVDISALVQQAIKRGTDEAASKQAPKQTKIPIDAGTVLDVSLESNKPVEEHSKKVSVYNKASSKEVTGTLKESSMRVTGSLASPEVRKDFLYNKLFSSFDGDGMEGLVPGPKPETPRSILNLTPLSLDKTTNQPETAYESRLNEWETILKQDISEENGKKRSSRNNSLRRKRLLHGKSVNKVETAQEEFEEEEEHVLEKAAKKRSARGSRDERSPHDNPKVTGHERSSRHLTATLPHPNNTESHKMKTSSKLHGNVFHNQGNRAGNKYVKKKKAHFRIENLADSDTSRDSDTPVTVAAICAGVVMLLLIVTGLTRLWQDCKNRPRICNLAELGLMIVSPNADCIDELSDEEVIYERRTCHAEVFKERVFTSTPELCPQIPQDPSASLYTNCLSLNVECDEEFSDGEVIYESPTCHVAAFKRPASTPESCAQISQVTPPFYISTSYEIVDVECDEEFSDGEII